MPILPIRMNLSWANGPERAPVEDWSFTRFNDLIGPLFSPSLPLSLDVRGVQFIDPYVIGGLAMAQLARTDETGQALPLDFLHLEPKVASYLHRMNFPFRGNRILQVAQGDEDSPVLLELFQIRERADGDTVAGHVLQSLQHRLGYAPGLAHTVFDALSEAFQNSLEHGLWSPLVIMQVFRRYDPQHQRLVLAVLDAGVGIRQSLSQNPRYRNLQDDRQALELALKQGVSGVHTDTTRGQGLWHLQQICQRQGGRLTVRSGTAQIFYTSEKTYWFQTPPIPGTQLRLELFHL